MRGMAWVGLLLIVLGVGGLAVRTFSFTTTEKVLDIGPIHATADKEHNVYIYPVAGVTAIVAGAAFIFLGRRRA